MTAAFNHAQIEQHQTLVNPLQHAFACLAFNYGMTIKEAERGELSGSALDCLEAQCENLQTLAAAARKTLRGCVQ
jgi:hypothetical protein